MKTVKDQIEDLFNQHINVSLIKTKAERGAYNCLNYQFLSENKFDEYLPKDFNINDFCVEYACFSIKLNRSWGGPIFQIVYNVFFKKHLTFRYIMDFSIDSEIDDDYFIYVY